MCVRVRVYVPSYSCISFTYMHIRTAHTFIHTYLFTHARVGIGICIQCARTRTHTHTHMQYMHTHMSFLCSLYLHASFLLLIAPPFLLQPLPPPPSLVLLTVCVCVCVFGWTRRVGWGRGIGGEAQDIRRECEKGRAFHKRADTKHRGGWESGKASGEKNDRGGAGPAS